MLIRPLLMRTAIRILQLIMIIIIIIMNGKIQTVGNSGCKVDEIEGIIVLDVEQHVGEDSDKERDKIEE